MKKKLTVLCLCTLSIYLLCGCHFFSANENPGSLREPISANPETLSGEGEPKADTDGADADGNGNYTTISSDNQFPELHITEKKLLIPGLTGQYSLLFLTDNHIICLDGTESGQITENALPRAELFKDGNGVSSCDRFPEWMEYAQKADVDLVLFGGDIIDFPSEANLNLLAENLGRLDMPYVYTLGNHDWTYPWEYMTPEGREEYRPLFAPFTKDNPAASVTELEEFVILSVDNSSNQVEAEALPFVEEAFASGKPVIVLLHVPFSTETLLPQAASVWSSPVSIGMADKGGFFPDANTAAFQEKILSEDSPVVCVLAGHVHFADEASLTERVVQYVGDAAYKGEGMLLRISGE